MSLVPTSFYYGNAVGLVQEHSDYVRLRYHAGQRQAVEFQALLGHVTRALARHGAGKLLIDQRAMAPYSPPEQAYVLQQWLPRTIVEGHYRWGAVVMAQDVFARLAMDTIRTQAQTLPLTYRFFTEEPEALAWLHMC
ncbi:hypothetical protein BXP70_26870 [Hymenobacter crusticola]|uniref:STAS/SEC14 domain-containing protein n=2 Tax=Hymenobacter crusticola TaxID=1770526 RepID=A0A243W627_9BACT|nr:hypothetical protein BXP70_26870 [Hymenobacter crusticola]